MTRTSRWLIIMLIAITLAACNAATPTAQPRPTNLPQATPALQAPTQPVAPIDSTATPNSPASPTPSGVIRDPVTAADRADAQAVVLDTLPIGDLRELAIKFKGLPADSPDHTCTTAPEYSVGDELTFHVSNSQTFEQFVVTATLISKEEHVYMWVDNKWLDQVDKAKVVASGKIFNDKIYPRDRELFGSEWSPGIDCDPRLHVLNTSNTGAGGYFSSVDEYTRAVRPDSNEKEMFIIDLEGRGGPSQIGSSVYLTTLAHEFQHMIHFHIHRNQEVWANEGMSVLAEFLNGYDSGGVDFAFAEQPNTQLNFWPEGPLCGECYGAAFTFWLYFYDKYGETGLKDIVADPHNGLLGVADALKQVGYKGTLDDFFADWVIAKFLNKPSLDDGRYGFTQSQPPLAALTQKIDSYPFGEQNSVNEYAAKYFAFTGDKDVTVKFTGSTKARMIDATPHSGQYFWWSNRGDSTDLALTHEFDLSNVKTATLKYWTWYSLEKDWDYGYVDVSTDGGKTWKILKAPSSTDRNPNNNSYGWGYTGSSGNGGGTNARPQWIQESVDLSEYAGKKIMISFEVVNDLAVNLPGLAIDDVEIPEINYTDNFENDDGGWQSTGWLRTNNFVPQTFIPQLISFGQDGAVSVARLPLNDDNTGQWAIPLSTLKQAVIVISPTALKSSEPALFQWSIAEK